jgi:hypothetical protein
MHAISCHAVLIKTLFYILSLLVEDIEKLRKHLGIDRYPTDHPVDVPMYDNN